MTQPAAGWRNVLPDGSIADEVRSTKRRCLAFGVEPSNRRYRLRLSRYRGIAELIAGKAAPSGNGAPRVLDAGCGHGRIPMYYRGLKGAGPVSFVGLDRSPGRIKQASAAGFSLLKLGSIIHLPYRDAQFDGVVCEQVLEHLEDEELDTTLKEFRRVLRPGGFAVIGVPIFTDPELWVKPIWLWGRSILSRFTGSEPGHHQHFSLGTLCAVLRRYGFEVEQAQGYRLFSFFQAWFEDLWGYYLLHRRLGKAFPGLCGEVDVLCRRP